MTEKVSAKPMKCSKPAEIFRTNEGLNLMDANAVNTDGLRELLAKATPGEWELPTGPSSASDIFSDGDWNIYPPTGEAGPIAIAAGEHNAELIAAAVNSLPTLLDRLAAVEAELAALRADAVRYRWLRSLDGRCTSAACVNFNIGHDWIECHGDELDAAIDAARLLPDSGEGVL